MLRLGMAAFCQNELIVPHDVTVTPTAWAILTELDPFIMILFPHVTETVGVQVTPIEHGGLLHRLRLGVMMISSC